MELNRGALGGGNGYGAPDGMQLRRRERALEALLHELLFPSTPPSSSPELCGFSESGSSRVKAPASSAGCQRRSRDSKRVRQGERGHQAEQEQRGGCSTAVKAARGRKKNQGKMTTLVTTVPGFDGYQWRKYGQKQIEATQYSRSYYRCIHSTDKACPAKRTVQRNNDGDVVDTGQPKYTVVYISEHSCMGTMEAAAAPTTILDTSLRTKTTTAPGFFPSSSSAISAGTQSLASSDTTWSGGTVAGADPTPNDCPGSWSMYPVEGDCWEEELQEMDFDAGPIMSPVHVAAADGGWIHDLFDNASPFV